MLLLLVSLFGCTTLFLLAVAPSCTEKLTVFFSPQSRSALKERRERVRLAIEDVRRFAGARGANFLLPRIGVETTAAASAGWDVRTVPSQREVVKG